MTSGSSSAAEKDAPRYTARLLIGCADRPGIVAGVSGFLFERGANIVSSHQYSTDPTGGRFFLRTEFFLEDPFERELFQEGFEAEVARRFEMDWEMRWWGERRRVAILVSRQDHCLHDLLWRWRRGELDAEIVAVISNHRDLEEEAVAAGVAFHHVPVAQDGKERAEAEMLELLEGNAELARVGALHADPQRRLPGAGGDAGDSSCRRRERAGRRMTTAREPLGLRALQLLAEDQMVSVLGGLADGPIRPAELVIRRLRRLFRRLRRLLHGELVRCERQFGLPPHPPILAALPSRAGLTTA
jgi:hypothetical protein